MILILVRQHNWTQGQAIAHLQEQVRVRMEQFLMLETCLPRLCEVLGITGGQRASLHTYQVDGLRALIRGTYDWHRRSGRYTPRYAIPGGRPGYLQDTGQPGPPHQPAS